MRRIPQPPVFVRIAYATEYTLCLVMIIVVRTYTLLRCVFKRDGYHRYQNVCIHNMTICIIYTSVCVRTHVPCDTYDIRNVSSSI